MKLFNEAISGKTQADGAFSVSLLGADRFLYHQIQVSLSAVPDAGSLAVAVKSPGAAGFVPIDGTFVLTGTELLKTFGPVFAEAIQFTPTDLDSDVTYGVVVTSGGGE